MGKGIKTMFWYVAGAAVIAAGIVMARKMLRDNRDPGSLPGSDRHAKAIGVVVLEAFETDWAKRFAVTAERLRAAVLDGGDADLATRIDAAVGVVDLKFDAAGQKRGNIAATIIVNYPHDNATSTAQLTLPWDQVPDAVRADLLRSAQKAVFRKWRAMPGQRVGS
jgi:hypothetical protein